MPLLSDFKFKKNKGFLSIWLILVLLVIFASVAGFIYYKARTASKNLPVTPPKKIIKIGILRYIAILKPTEDGFKAGMAKLGYVEGKNVTYELIKDDSDMQVLEKNAKTLIDDNVDLIYAPSAVSAKAALKEATLSGKPNIPIVFAHADHPVETGLIKSMASSGNNTTGVSIDLSVQTQKRLYFLKLINPAIKKLGVFTADYTDPAGKEALDELRKQVSNFGIKLVEYNIKSPVATSTPEVQKIVNSIKPGDIDALFLTPGAVQSKTENTQLEVDMAKRLKIPSTPDVDTIVGQGALFSYSNDMYAIGEQASVIADKVLKGMKPSDIPVEEPLKYNLVVNLKTAKEIGVTIPDSMLAIADKKID